MRENKFQAQLINELYEMFPGAMVLKNDSGYRQGILDLTILWKEHWAMLEVKASRTAQVRPNQDWYVDQLAAMSFAAYIYPENKDEVLNALQQAFTSRR